MTTRDTIQRYFDSLKRKGAWDDFLADDMQFSSFTTPVKRVAGRAAYLEATKRFFSMITDMEVKGVLVEGDRACALTRYALRPPAGSGFESHVAELFQVSDGKITSLDIYFDSSPFPK
jgi:ketosteroid isomerase-like protein